MGTAGRIIAKCGLVCDNCGAFKAALQNSDEIRKQTADEWSKMFGVTIDWKTVNCAGCQAQGEAKVFSHCLVCGIRSCALEKGFATCASCPEYGCEKVSQIWKHDQQAKANLEALR